MEPGVFTTALRSSGGPLSIYVHVPFCERLCLYCGCNVVIDRTHTAAGSYVDSLIAEMDLHSEQHGRLATEMHWGGGTPTYLDPRQITLLFNAIVSRFPLPATAEISIEIDPRVTTPEHLQTLRWLGFNRISVGIQDFDAVVQAAVRRFQSIEATRKIFDKARSLGFDSINADLIYGLPHQTPQSFARTLDQVIELAPHRLAVFSYAHVPSMKRQQRSFEKHLPDESRKLELFELALARLKSAGYEHVGMDHFALPSDPLVAARDNGTLRRNFQGYTTHGGLDLLGFGVSAISHSGRTWAQNHRELSHYHDAVRRGRVPVFRGHVLTPDHRIRAAVIDSLLCSDNVRKDAIEQSFSIDFDDYFRSELMRLEEFELDGLITGRTERALDVTPAGRVFVRTIARVFDTFPGSAIASKAV
jgi:oxygen-independent coproporphyrinogen-3 oxidase